jgi:hypothetical protein
MCIKLNSVFRNNYLKIETKIVLGDNSKYDSPMIINGVIVETDGFEVLSIEQSENYGAEQLKIFDYDIKHGCYILKNYNLKTSVPINITNKNTKELSFDNLFVEIDDNNGETIRKLNLFDKEIIVNGWDLVGAFNNLHRKIKQNYTVKMCAFCKKSCWNPYGGIDFFNHLCFKEFEEEYYKLDIKNKEAIGCLMNKNMEKYKSVYLINSCNDYRE